jgi:lipoyl synthase
MSPTVLPAKQSKPPTPPSWLKVNLPVYNEAVQRLLKQTKESGLATVCQQARCPNLGECWAEGTATLMLMGEACTRHCSFCAVPTVKHPHALNPHEPQLVAKLVADCGWQYVVLTSVNRDDLADGGALHVAQTIQAVRQASPAIVVEALIPDFAGSESALKTLLQQGPPDVLAHNIETVERLSPQLRDRRATYRQSLALLKLAGQLKPSLNLKSSLMLGVGETDEELLQAFADLRAAGVTLLSLGQYLRPTEAHWPVANYIDPARFGYWKDVAETQFGFAYCAAGPLVRSSYKAMEAFIQAQGLF